jgi:hypothetical protein
VAVESIGIVRVLGSGFRVLGSGFWVLGLEFWVRSFLLRAMYEVSASLHP